MSSSLDALKATGTLVVADSGNLKALAGLGAVDATTNRALPRRVLRHALGGRRG